MFHAILLPVFIEFSRCIGTYSSAKFELQLNNDIDKSSPVTDVFVHYNEEKLGDKKITVSVGISGQARGSKHNDEYARELERSLNEMAGYEKYVVSSITDPDLLEQIRMHEDRNRYPKAGTFVPNRGVCAEPKAASAAHKNNAPIVGFDVRHFNGEGVGNNYPLKNATASNQMDTCDRCKFNGEVIVNYANSTK